MVLSYTSDEYIGWRNTCTDSIIGGKRGKQGEHENISIQYSTPPYHLPSFDEGGLRLSRPRRNESMRNGVRLSLPFSDSGGKARLRLLLRSAKLFSIFFVTTPFSSVAKSKPRSTETIPVDMSVLLAARTSTDGRCLGSTETMLPVREVLCDERDRGRFNTLRPLANRASTARSR